MALPRSLWRRWFVLCVPQRLPLCVPPPRPIGSSLLVLKLPLLVPSGAGRGLKVCSSCRRCVLRASNGFPARSGATRAAKPPKTERGAFPTKRACRESAALGLPPCGGRRPSPLRRGQFRAQPTAKPAWSAPRAAYAYRLRLFSSDGENRSPRWGRLRDTTTDDNGTRGGAVGVVCAAVRKSGLRGTWGALGGLGVAFATRVNRAGPSEARMGGRGGDRGKHPHKMKSTKAWIAAKRSKAETERGTSGTRRGTLKTHRGTSPDERGKTELDRGRTETERGTSRTASIGSELR